MRSSSACVAQNRGQAGLSCSLFLASDCERAWPHGDSGHLTLPTPPRCDRVPLCHRSVLIGIHVETERCRWASQTTGVAFNRDSGDGRKTAFKRQRTRARTSRNISSAGNPPGSTRLRDRVNTLHHLGHALVIQLLVRVAGQVIVLVPHERGVGHHDGGVALIPVVHVV
jgi:hypothetical protein